MLLKGYIHMLQKIKLNVNEIKNIAGGFKGLTEICDVSFGHMSIQLFVAQYCPDEGMVACTEFESFNDILDAVDFANNLKPCEGQIKSPIKFRCIYNILESIMYPEYFISTTDKYKS